MKGRQLRAAGVVGREDECFRYLRKDTDRTEGWSGITGSPGDSGLDGCRAGDILGLSKV